MKKIAYFLFPFFALAVFSVSAIQCVKAPDVTEGENEGIDEGLVAVFVEKSDYGIYDGKSEPVYILDIMTNEMVYNVKSKKFAITDENRSAVFTAVLTERDDPEFYSVEVVSSLENAEAGQFIMKAVKKEGDRLWLWENSNRFGLVILFE